VLGLIFVLMCGSGLCSWGLWCVFSGCGTLIFVVLVTFVLVFFGYWVLCSILWCVCLVVTWCVVCLFGCGVRNVLVVLILGCFSVVLVSSLVFPRFLCDVGHGILACAYGVYVFRWYQLVFCDFFHCF